jgi:serine protease Do
MASAPTPAAFAPVAPSGSTLPSFADAIARSAHTAVGVYGLGWRDDANAPGDDAPFSPGPGGAARAGRSGEPATQPLTARRPTEEPDYDEGTIGAGFFIDGEGHIVTAGHVVVQAREVLVKLQSQQVLRAELLGYDADTDIALLRVPPPPGVQPVLGHSLSLRPGDWVLAMGEPYGLARTVMAGIVGGTNRHFSDDRDSAFIQTDVALGPGNSGGPLLDVSGVIVGMNSRVVVGSFGSPGLGLAVPIEIVLQVAQELRGQPTIVRPRLGARFSDVTPQAAIKARRAYASGALITEVEPQGLARTLRLQVGDIITGMNGQPVGDGADLVRLLLSWRSAPGTVFTLYRDGQYRQITVP